jgi:hypothetical protein
MRLEEGCRALMVRVLVGSASAAPSAATTALLQT